jgi:hypothetical protein
MKKNLRITVGCLTVLVLGLVVGITLWWTPRRASGPAPTYQE